MYKKNVLILVGAVKAIINKFLDSHPTFFKILGGGTNFIFCFLSYFLKNAVNLKEIGLNLAKIKIKFFGAGEKNRGGRGWESRIFFIMALIHNGPIHLNSTTASCLFYIKVDSNTMWTYNLLTIFMKPHYTLLLPTNISNVNKNTNPGFQCINLLFLQYD